MSILKSRNLRMPIRIKIQTNQTMTLPSPNDAPLSASAPVEFEHVKNDGAASASEGDKGKPVKRGVRGPRALRRNRIAARASDNQSGDTSEFASEGGNEKKRNRHEMAEADQQAGPAEEAGPAGDVSSAAARNQAPRAPRNGKAKGKPGNGKNRPPAARAKGAVPDDVFSYVTSEAYDRDVPESGANGKGRTAGKGKLVRRDLTADDDAPKLHKVLAEAGLGS